MGSNENIKKASPWLKGLGRVTWLSINRLLDLSMILAFGSLMTLLAVGVFFRYVLNSGILGLDELALLVVAYAFYIGAALGMRNREHVVVTLINLIPVLNKYMRAIGRIRDFITMVVVTAIAFYVMRHFLNISSLPGTYMPFPFPQKFFVAGVMIGWVLMSLYSIIGFVKTVYKGVSK